MKISLVLALALSGVVTASEGARSPDADLSGRLQDALSHVASTEQTVRGYVVSLPEILFDLNQATLKREAQHVLSKLSGILLVMPDLKVKVEGHTDSTGSADYSLQLSLNRAESAVGFFETRRLLRIG